ncbi:MAG: ATP-binding SpoIIE family protein phosphatase, partial [bacterium]
VQSAPIGSVLRTGESLLISQGSEGMSSSADLRDLGIQTAMIVPLLARGRVLGAVIYGSITRAFSREDLEFAEALCRRAALAMDNARLYERERAVAETLQRSLLPQSLPSLPGVSTAARYLPATPEAVGGDWYDSFHLPGGRMGLVMGDVAGRGVRVAAVMGQLRNALRAYALEGYPPDVVIKRLTALIDPADMATVFYAVFDPATWDVLYANAGHPPPLVIGPDRRATFLEGGVPPLRGLRTPTYPGTVVTRLEPGSTMLLYTDGLVEKRGVPIDEGLQKLVQVAMQGNGDLEALLDQILSDILHGEPTGDDVALLALKASRLDPSRLSIRLPADPLSVPVIRHALRRWLDQAGVDRPDTYQIAVAVCEAASNTVEHAYGLRSGDVEVNASMEAGEVVIAVSDSGQWRPPRGRNRGRGLPLVDALMSGVEVSPSPSGTTISMRRRISVPVSV